MTVDPSSLQITLSDPNVLGRNSSKIICVCTPNPIDVRSGGSIEIGQTFEEGKIKSTRNTQQFLKAMSQLRNTSVPDCGVFRAEIVFRTPLEQGCEKFYSKLIIQAAFRYYK